MINQDRMDKPKTQTLIFDKSKFTVAEAKAWATEHGYHAGKVDVTEGVIRLRQVEPSKFKKGSFRTIQFKSGIQAVIGELA